MSDNQNEEPYNGAAYGFSPYDLMDFECRSCFEQGGAGGYPDPEEDYDCCDDAKDYSDDDSDDEEAGDD